MSDRHEVEVHDADGVLLATAAVVGGEGADATLVDFHVGPRHLPTGARSALVDTVLDGPELAAGTPVRATAPAGDSEVIARLLARTDNPTSRRAGATCLVEGTVAPTDGD